MISANIVADSVNEFGNRITTMLVTMPRIILAEFNTHRVFSRNSASSRAIPFEKMIKSVEENPFIPIAWQKDHKGMQGTEYITDPNIIELAKDRWLQARDVAIHEAKILYGMPFTINEKEFTIGVTKQLCNRLLEPFMQHTVIVTATEWENFFALRCPQYHHVNTDKFFRSKRDWTQFNFHGADKEQKKIYTVPIGILDWQDINKGQAEIHMMLTAEAMWDAFSSSVPILVKAGEWHIPFEDKLNNEELYKLAFEQRGNTDGLYDQIKNNLKVKISTVMAARTSYTVVGNDLKPLTYQRMVEIHDEMLAADPIHASPFEHCAKAMNNAQYTCDKRGDIKYGEAHGYSANFRGWIQYRKMIPNENITK